MNRKGFTLVELLAVIVLMTILVTVAVPSVTKIGRSLKTESFCSKVKVIEAAALEYATDYFTGRESSSNGIVGVSLDNVSLMDLVNMGYLKTDISIGVDSNNKPTECNLYTVNSKCLLDPRDNSAMDYETVRIWTSNKRLYATYRYKDSDVENSTDGVCGNNMRYERKIIDSGITSQSLSDDSTFFNKEITVIKAKKNNIYNWSNYYSYRTTRPDDIPGNYYVNSITVNYSLTNSAVMELSIGDLYTEIVTSGSRRVIGLSGSNLSNVDLSFRVALNSATRRNDSKGKVTKLDLTWKKIS